MQWKLARTCMLMNRHVGMCMFDCWSYYFSYNFFVFSLLVNFLWLLCKNGSTSLYCASSGGHTDIVRLLLEKGANTEAPDKVNERGHSVCGVCWHNSLHLNEWTEILLYFFMIYQFMSSDIMKMFSLSMYVLCVYAMNACMCMYVCWWTNMWGEYVFFTVDHTLFLI